MVAHRDVAGRDVGNQLRDEERRNLPRAAGVELGALLDEGLHAADAGADIDAEALRRDLARDAAVLHRLGGRGHCVLAVKVGPAEHGLFHIIFRMEVPDLGGQLHLVAGSVELGDGTDSVFARNQAVPEGFYIISHRRHGAHAGHNHSSAHSTLPWIPKFRAFRCKALRRRG